jgi:Condensation domain/AMP-binding enzyme
MRQKGMRADIRTLFASPALSDLAAAASTDVSEMKVPENRIPTPCDSLTPDMLPLVALSPAEIERIVAAVPGGAANVQDIYPLAPLQEGILFHHLTSKEGDAYLLPYLMSFDSRERLDGFIAAMQAVVDRHDTLRTAILWENLPEPLQIVWRCAKLPLEEVPVEAHLEAEAQLRSRVNPRHYRMDVRQAPMLRLYIAKDALDDRWLLMVLLHHLAGDHTTLDLIQKEIQVHLQGQAHRLPKPVPFRNLVAQARLGAKPEEHEAFFRKMLGDVDDPTAPFGLMNVQGDGHEIREAHLPVDQEVAGRLRAVARRMGISAASVTHLAWALVLSRLTGRDDVVFGSVLFGRMQGSEGADRGVGLFMNTLPVRVRLGEDGAETGVRQTQVLLADLMKHEHASLALAQRCSAIAAPMPLFTTLLNYRHSGNDFSSSQAEEMSWQGIEYIGTEERTNYPLTLHVDDLGEAIRLKVQVHHSVEPMRICRLMHRAMEQLVDALEDYPQTPVRNLDVLPEEERLLVLKTWNATEAAFPAGRCVHELFEIQVSRTPEAVAVFYEDQRLTYAELNARANRLAHHLRSLGVKPDSRVAICAERSLERRTCRLTRCIQWSVCGTCWRTASRWSC